MVFDGDMLGKLRKWQEEKRQMKALAMLWHEARLEQMMRNPGFYERYLIWVFKILHGWSNKKKAGIKYVSCYRNNWIHCKFKIM